MKFRRGTSLGWNEHSSSSSKSCETSAVRFALIMAFAKSGPGKIAPLGEQFFKSERPADAPFGSGIQTSDLPVPSSPVHLAFSHVASSQRLKFPVAGQWIHLGPINGKCRVISCESFTAHCSVCTCIQRQNISVKTNIGKMTHSNI